MGLIATFECTSCGYVSETLTLGPAPYPEKHAPVLVSCPTVLITHSVQRAPTGDDDNDAPRPSELDLSSIVEDDLAVPPSTKPRRIPSWAGVADWHVPSVALSWAGYDAWAPSFDQLAAACAARLAKLADGWDNKLADLGGDPARADWYRFRPLRLSREEDWSDWLAHLLETSKSGRFSARLFAGALDEPLRWRVKHADREVVAEDHRADIVVHFAAGDWAHVEVKAGDLSLAKTPGTGLALARTVSGTKRGDFLLLPEADVRWWNGEQGSLGSSAAKIQVLTWHDTARALRRSALEATHETVNWRVWAITFAGAVEQRLLGFPPVPKGARPARARPSMHDIALADYLEGLDQP